MVPRLVQDFMPSECVSLGESTKTGTAEKDTGGDKGRNGRGFSYFVAFHRVVQVLQEIEVEYIQEGKNAHILSTYLNYIYPIYISFNYE